MKGLD